MVINQAALQAIYVNLKTTFDARMEITETYWEKVASKVPSTGKSNDYKWLGAFPMLREWIGERQIQNISAYEYLIRNKSFEATIGVDRDDIEDDNLGVYVPVVEQLADSSKKHPDKLIFDLMVNGFSNTCYDGEIFFSAAHPVGGTTYSNVQAGSGNPWFLMDTKKPLKPFLYQHRRDPEFVSFTDLKDPNVFWKKEYIYGVDYRGNVGYAFWQQAFASKADLTVSNYSAARLAMRTLKNEKGVPLDVSPNLLVCGPSNEEAAREILEVDVIYNTSGDGSWQKNLWRNSCDLLVVPWLD